MINVKFGLLLALGVHQLGASLRPLNFDQSLSPTHVGRMIEQVTDLFHTIRSSNLAKKTTLNRVTEQLFDLIGEIYLLNYCFKISIPERCAHLEDLTYISSLIEQLLLEFRQTAPINEVETWFNYRLFSQIQFKLNLVKS